MSAYTKGPWSIAKHSWAQTGVYCGARQIALINIEPYANEDNQSALEIEAAANARLIAAAPELLESLIEMRDLFSLMYGSGPREGPTCSPNFKADAAISKATGESA